MERKLKRIKALREALEYDLGASELDIIDELMELFLESLREHWKEINKLSENLQ